MLDRKQLKALGLRYARALQTTVKTAGVFTVEHKSTDRPIQQSFLLLNNLLKETGQFTFGFVDNQVLLNNLLTADPTLRHLETEFLKRGISAITVEPGLTLARYKKIISVLSTPLATIESIGGVLAFLDRSEVEGVRIIPAARNQRKNNDGDTILETDSESYILSKQIADGQASRDLLDSIDTLLESGAFDPSVRGEVLSNLAAQGMDGSGYGVPVQVAKLVTLHDGEKVVSENDPSEPSEPRDDKGRAVSAAAAGYSGGSSGPSVGSGTGTSGGTGIGYASTGPGLDQSLLQASPGRGGSPGRTKETAPNTFLDLVESSVQRSLLEEKGDPRKSYASLARILRNTGVDKILQQFPPERQDELRALSPEQLAGEYIEDTALQLAGARLQSATTESQRFVVEEEVVHLLARSLQATHMADRLAQKLIQFIQDFAVPQHIQDRIREELQWNSLNSARKFARLMELRHCSNIEFRRLIELCKELVSQRDLERACALACHYSEFLEDPAARVESAELSRVPELIQAISVAHAGFASKTTERLGRTLMREDVSEYIHFQTANALMILAQSISTFEDFNGVYVIATWLEKSSSRNRAQHARCCEAGLPRLLPSVAVERILELFLSQKGDSAWSRTAAALLRFSAPASIELLFKRVVEEPEAKNRLSLLRLAGQLGPGSLEVARKYLEDSRWYVVRNMCGILAELKDPQLVEHIAPALKHPDPRVQQASLKAIFKARARNTGSVLAGALSSLAPDNLDETLNELMYLKDTGAVTALEQFVNSKTSNLASVKKAIQVLGVIQDDVALHALARVFTVEELDPAVRRAALVAIARHPSPLAEQLLEQMAGNWGSLAEEAKNELERRKQK